MPSITPTPQQLLVAKTARKVKVYMYDLEYAGFQPSLNLSAPDGPACHCAPRRDGGLVTPAGFAHDLCNHSFGRLYRRAAAIHVHRAC